MAISKKSLRHWTDDRWALLRAISQFNTRSVNSTESLSRTEFQTPSLFSPFCITQRQLPSALGAIRWSLPHFGLAPSLHGWKSLSSLPEAKGFLLNKFMISGQARRARLVSGLNMSNLSQGPSWLIGKDCDAGKTEGRRRRGWQGEMAGWHLWLKGHEFKQTPGDGEGQRSLACYSPLCHKESDMT